MKAVIVVENPRRWTLQTPGIPVVAASEYLAGSAPGLDRSVVVLNFCRTSSYQTVGYYVSLVAAARGHRPLPTIETLQDLRLQAVKRVVSGRLGEVATRALPPNGERATVHAYFGRSPDPAHVPLARELYDQLRVPFLRAIFARAPQGTWRLETVKAMSAVEVPDADVPLVLEAVNRWVARPTQRTQRVDNRSFDLAILADPNEKEPPSDASAIRRFVRAAERAGAYAEVIGPDDVARLPAFDALFIRVTTAVNHFSYRWARQAEAEGLVVMDDPSSIVRCTNKIYLAEAFLRRGVPAPRTWIAARDAEQTMLSEVTFPCVVKSPDSAFSRGVARADDYVQLERRLADVYEGSALALVQAFVPSAFDWRVGVLDRKPLFACRYHMAPGHWQIIRTLSTGARRAGRVEAVPLESVPEPVVSVALKAAGLVGDGFYGVDVKETADGKVVVMEVNDNPSVDAGFEDAFVGNALYDAVIASFRERLERPRRKGVGP